MVGAVVSGLFTLLFFLSLELVTLSSGTVRCRDRDELPLAERAQAEKAATSVVHAAVQHDIEWLWRESDVRFQWVTERAQLQRVLDQALPAGTEPAAAELLDLRWLTVKGSQTGSVVCGSLDEEDPTHAVFLVEAEDEEVALASFGVRTREGPRCLLVDLRQQDGRWWLFALRILPAESVAQCSTVVQDA